MKILSVFSVAVTAAALMFSVAPANAETTLTEAVLGDLDLNNSFSLSDVVKMQNYLHGLTSLSEQAFLNADINNDGSVDVFDMCLLRKKLISESGSISTKVSDLQNEDGIHQEAHEYVITSVNDLFDFFGPLHVITVDGDCFDSPTTSEEDIKKYTEIYNEEFFDNNVLLLKIIEKPDGGENNIGNVYYSGERLHAEFYQTYSGNKTGSYEQHYQLLQVIIPRALDIAKSFDWVYRYPDAEATITTDYSRELTSTGWKSAIYGNNVQYLSDKRSFDKWADGKFHSAVERELKNKYNDAFFSKNDLVINLYAHNGDKFSVTPETEITSDIVKLTYTRESTDKPAPQGVYITQAVIPKGSCYRKKAEVKYEGLSKTTLSYKEFDLGMLCLTNNKDMVTKHSMEPKWIHSQNELDEYLGECLTDEAIELINLKTNGHTAYVWLDSGIIGTTQKIAASYIAKEEKALELNVLSDVPFGDEGGSFLHILYASADLAGYDVKITEYNIDDNYPTFDEYPIEIMFRNDDSRTLFVNQYSFGNEYSADLYLTYPGGGPIRYSKYEYIGTIELSPDFKPFSEEYTYAENNDGSYTVTGDAFKIVYSDGILKVSCKTAPYSEYTAAEFDIGKK